MQDTQWDCQAPEKKGNQKNKEQTIFPGAKPLILQSDIFLIVYVVFCFIFTQLDCTGLQRKSKEGMLVPGKEGEFLSLAPTQPMAVVLYIYCKRWLHLDYSWGVLTVLKTLQVFSDTEGESFFVQSLLCQSHAFPYRQDAVAAWISDETNMKSVTMNGEFLTQPLGICCIEISTVEGGTRALFKQAWYNTIAKVQSSFVCQDRDQGLADCKLFCGQQLWFMPFQAFKTVLNKLE